MHLVRKNFCSNDQKVFRWSNAAAYTTRVLSIGSVVGYKLSGCQLRKVLWHKQTSVVCQILRRITNSAVVITGRCRKAATCRNCFYSLSQKSTFCP